MPSGSLGRPKRTEREKRLAREVSERMRQAFMAEPKGLSQRKLAHLIGVQFTTVNQWFRAPDPALPTGLALVKIAKAERLSLDWLMLGEGPLLRGAATGSRSRPVQIQQTLLAEVLNRKELNEGWTTALFPSYEKIVDLLHDHLKLIQRSVGYYDTKRAMAERDKANRKAEDERKVRIAEWIARGGKMERSEAPAPTATGSKPRAKSVRRHPSN